MQRHYCRCRNNFRPVDGSIAKFAGLTFSFDTIVFSYVWREVPKIAPWSEPEGSGDAYVLIMVSAGRLSLAVHWVSQPPHDKES